ncbi:hypothetical protein Ade02nite_23700 [Paractinoplanes deccanensis]|uniref:Uncharacterized protein n=1 Tax=Paractinoplanes deccanensis TaxID=113561 RepID=A0ABQ3Y148_9ACTN|nr:hypothetical protein [Actinoplanes deccanensis]GID73729.1 hypothetical protein Ade02nite_23700 [Actinoplanes deccanensis]
MARPDDTKIKPNDLLRVARLRVLSPAGSGRPLSRAELAELVSAWVYEQTGLIDPFDASDVAKLERGEVRWPRKVRRRALRHVLGASNDARIGLLSPYVNRSSDEAFMAKHGLTPPDPGSRELVSVPATVVTTKSVPTGQGPVGSPTVSCTVEGTESGGVRIVVNLEPGVPGAEPAVVVTSGPVAEVRSLPGVQPARRELSA